MNIKGIGVDLIKISKIKKINQSYSNEVLSYLYSDAEKRLCCDFIHPVLAYAICFSGKESVGKALGTGLGGLNWFDIEILFHIKKVNLKGDAFRIANKLSINKWFFYWRAINDIVMTLVIAK